MRTETIRQCGDVKKQSEVKVADIENKIRDLQRMHTALAQLIRWCEDNEPITECPIIKVLSQE